MRHPILAFALIGFASSVAMASPNGDQLDKRTRNLDRPSHVQLGPRPFSWWTT